MHVLVLLLVGVHLHLSGQLETTARLTGTVVSDAQPTPGVTVTAAGPVGEESVVTDDRGRFAFAGLLPGAYVITTTLAGFRREKVDVTLVAGAMKDVPITLRPAPLISVLYVVPRDLDEAYRSADAIAHVRIERTEQPGRCQSIVSTTHHASVFTVFKVPADGGALPATIQLVQDAAGACDENGELIEGIERPVYAADEEYIAFLRGRGDRCGRIAGRSWMLPVRRGMVELSEYAQRSLGRNSMTLADFAAAIGHLAR